MKNLCSFQAAVTAFALVAIFGQNSHGQDERLPEPIGRSSRTTDRVPLVDTSSVDRNQKIRLERAEIEANNRALRMERNRRISEAKTELLIAQMNAGYNPHRPTVNAGYMYMSPTTSRYRWSMIYGPIYAPSYLQQSY